MEYTLLFVEAPDNFVCDCCFRKRMHLLRANVADVGEIHIVWFSLLAIGMRCTVVCLTRLSDDEFVLAYPEHGRNEE